MSEQICNQGHVIDPGRLNCSRCGGSPIGTAEVASVASALAENEEAKARGEEEVVKSEADLEAEALDVKSLTADELRAKLEARGIEFSSKDLKVDLQRKLKKALKNE